MRLVTFEERNNPGRQRVGAFVDGDSQIVDLAAVSDEASLASMQELIASGARGLELVQKIVEGLGSSTPDEALVSYDSVTLLAPLPRPLTLRDSLLFETHYKKAFEQIYRRIAADEPDPEAAYAAFEQAGKCGPPSHWYERPTFSYRNHLAIVGPDAEIRWPSNSEEMDYELELGCVIGTAGRDIKRADATRHIFGYTILNDFSARDVQRRTIQTGKGYVGASKDFDTGYSLGPCIVTADEIDNVYDLTMIARVNGEQWSHGTSSSIYHRLEDLIEAITIETTIHPGEVLGSGTMGGGCGLELNRFLQDGDIVELEIEKIGILRNCIRRSSSL